MGDTFELLTYSQTAGDSGSFGVDPPDRPPETVTMVGVVDGPNLGDPSKPLQPLVYLSSRTVEGTDIGVVTSLISVDLHDGVDLTGLRSSLDTLAGRPGADALTVEPLHAVSDTVRTAVRLQAVSLWLMASIAGVAAVAALGQLITRGARVAPDDELTLRSIGYGRTELIGESLGCAVVVIATGTALGTISAPIASPIFPTGFVAAIDPDHGVRLEATVLVLGALAMAAALTAWAAVALALVRTRLRAATPPALATRVASIAISPAVATGTRLAFARTGREAGSVRATVVGLVVAVAAVTGALTVGLSLHRLVTEPARFGADYDVYFGNGGLPDGTADQLLADPDIGALSLVSEGQVAAGERTVRVLWFDARRGEVMPRLLDGRLPLAADEVAFGAVEARSLAVGIGDTIELTGTAGTCACRVTGIVVIPSVGVNTGVGHDGALTGDGLRGLVADTVPGVALADVVPGATGAVERLASEYSATPAGFQELPEVIANLSLASGVPNALAVLLACLAGVGVAHAATLSVRRRRRDVAVLAALGAERSWLRTMAHWQVTAGVVVPVVAGVPLGFGAGTFVFRAIAGSIGAIDTPDLPLVRGLLVAAGVVVVANLAGAIPSRRARRARPADVLAGE